MFEVPASTSAPNAASYFEALAASTVLQLSPKRFLRAETTPVHLKGCVLSRSVSSFTVSQGFRAVAFGKPRDAKSHASAQVERCVVGATPAARITCRIAASTIFPENFFGQSYAVWQRKPTCSMHMRSLISPGASMTACWHFSANAVASPLTFGVGTLSMCCKYVGDRSAVVENSFRASTSNSFFGLLQPRPPCAPQTRRGPGSVLRRHRPHRNLHLLEP